MHYEWQVSALGTDQFSSDKHGNNAQQLTGSEKPSLGEVGVFFIYIYFFNFPSSSTNGQ